MLYDGVFWHPTASCILWPVWTPSCPSRSCYHRVTVPSRLSLLSLSPQAWFSAACLTPTGPCKLPPLATPLCLLSLLARVQHHVVAFPTCWEHTSLSLMVPRNHPPFYAGGFPEYPRPLTHLGWGAEFTTQPCCTSSDDNCPLTIVRCHSATCRIWVWSRGVKSATPPATLTCKQSPHHVT